MGLPGGMLLRLYLLIGTMIGAGMGLGWLVVRLDRFRGAQANLHQHLPQALGKGLFWVGLPLSVVGFMGRIDLDGHLYLAPLVAWLAILLGWCCSRLWIGLQSQVWSRSQRISFSLAAMLGNTGFIGYPVVLLLPQLGLSVFGWALFYDALGTLPGSYGLGPILASRQEHRSPAGGGQCWGQGLGQISRNPMIWAFSLGLVLKQVGLPAWLTSCLYAVAWLVVGLSLLLMGLRIQQLTSPRHVPTAAVAIAIKMLLVPMLLGLGLTALGIDGAIRLTMIVQAGMPSAFANLILAEAYDLDRDLSVTCVGLSSLSLLITLPLWLWIFPS